ncbi:hypothetical protein Tco_1562224 [Tanacetum coccineum]
MVHKHHNNNYFISIILIISTVHVSTVASADSIHGCGGFVQSSSSLLKSRKATDSKFYYSDITVQLTALNGIWLGIDNIIKSSHAKLWSPTVILRKGVDDDIEEKTLQSE